MCGGLLPGYHAGAHLCAWRFHLPFVLRPTTVEHHYRADTILKQLGKSQALIESVADRTSHDQRYSLDSTRIRTEWLPRISFQEGLQLTTDWYLNNKDWLHQARSTEYLQYYNHDYVRWSETLRKFGC